NTMCEVSIIIPSYKGSNEILIAVWGALSQTVTSKEIIVVDDNGIGTEEQIKTKEKLQKFIKENKIKYFAHEKNLNGSAARNTGIKA
ncbi:TPA: glycosyltransferase family 2 protein, partial [Enterococcus faecium]|nr:glycosyltransferase family 2 protein [Enterococcus faecium]